MASLISTTTVQPEAANTRGRSGLINEIREFWSQFFVQAFSPYRPELYYMRGPGPAWRAKHGRKPARKD
ncbi:hypothetical protein [Rhodopseudomonas pseudopalustris]|uniref:Uncharacterized protein n=2 Tax=Rhodopseudomonas TaxID=1073 RepID=Q133R3_RHOPS|nr:hypothetical protein [Rhodopseudomonas pseudopalustris]ABE40676.1 conserved hypothetical protein [Rhodopseudomonas palustris BisB5]MBB1094222.1 hypothetical protein [Rhodopseudomonas palustris]SEO54238.1 hypothetical protein SAMN05444123_103239 [Rhodopseudomonas pseudopalustris]